MRICDVRGCTKKGAKSISLKVEDQLGLHPESEFCFYLVKYDLIVDLCPDHRKMLDNDAKQAARDFRKRVKSLLLVGKFEEREERIVGGSS